MLTINEKKVLRFLLSSLTVDYSINQIAKKCSLTPNGALKILKKFEKEGILQQKKIANIISYTLRFTHTKTLPLFELVLIPELKGRLQYRFDDLSELQKLTKACILFGSYTDLKKDPDDLDVLFILKKDDYREYRKKLEEISSIVPVKIHDIIQTPQDFKKNIIKNDAVIERILKEGVVLWGQRTILRILKNVTKR